jgi:PIN domain nuclease of toxin-antitoxin system
VVIYVLDASAILRFLDLEAGFDRMKVVLDECKAKNTPAFIPAIQWGEVVGILAKRARMGGTASALAYLRDLPLVVVPADAQRAERSAIIKSAFGMSYMDSFAVELTSDSPNHVLITADFDFKSAETYIQIEFLPAKPTP